MRPTMSVEKVMPSVKNGSRKKVKWTNGLYLENMSDYGYRDLLFHFIIIIEI